MPTTSQTLSFSLHDEVEGQTFVRANVDLLTLHQFMGEVDEDKLWSLWRKGSEAWAEYSTLVLNHVNTQSRIGSPFQGFGALGAIS